MNKILSSQLTVNWTGWQAAPPDFDPVACPILARHYFTLPEELEGVVDPTTFEISTTDIEDATGAAGLVDVSAAVALVVA